MTDIYKWLFGARGRAGVAAPMEPLPDELLPYRATIEASVKPIIAGTVLEGPPINATGSQLGGKPWWPAGLDYPHDLDGQPLFLLAQINFAETEPLDGFPAAGLLQVFIAAGDLYGANLDDLTKPNGFHAVLHTDLAQRQINPALADARALPEPQIYLPLQEPLRARAIALTRDAMPVDIFDYRFETLLADIAADNDLAQLYADWHAAAPIRLGGYPSFTQEDPRVFHPGLGDVNLLTIDTTDGIMWGDCGIGQFLMHEADLKQRDFRRVAYNWDCC